MLYRVLFFGLFIINLLHIFDCYAGECDGLPKFITHPYIGGVGITDEISRYRSTVGHPYPGEVVDGKLLCQSNKHYFKIEKKIEKEEPIIIYAPCEGKIVGIFPEEDGKDEGKTGHKVDIEPTGYKGYRITIFHVRVTPSIFQAFEKGLILKAGTALGIHCWGSGGKKLIVYSDIAVWNNEKTSSAFCHMSDEVLKFYGVEKADDMIISQADRNKFQIICTDQHSNLQFSKKGYTYQYADPPPQDWVTVK